MIVGLDESGPKMNSQAIAREMEMVLLRWRAGLISEERATKEVAILQAMLRAWDQAELERKLDALRATLEARSRSGQGQKTWLSGEPWSGSWPGTCPARRSPG